MSKTRLDQLRVGDRVQKGGSPDSPLATVLAVSVPYGRRLPNVQVRYDNGTIRTKSLAYWVKVSR